MLDWHKAQAFAALISALSWPVIVAASIYAFRLELRGLLNRLSQIKRGKLFGQEFELDEKLDQLHEAAQKVEQEIAAAPSAPLQLTNVDKSKDLEGELLRDVNRSPKVTLMLLSAELDKRVQEILAASGWYKNIKMGSTLAAIEKLRAQGSLPEHVSGSVRLFQEVRSRIIHGRGADEQDVLRAIDSGFTLLRALDSIPLEVNTVFRTKVPIYSDPECTQLTPEITAVILETTSPGGAQKSFRIFPTRLNHFEVGKRVAWEWNLDRTWGPNWYKDEKGQCLSAWGSSGEFIGRHLDDL